VNLTTKGHYGLMAVAELAARHGQGPVPLKTIAESQGLSEHYLEQLFSPLRRAGIVRSVRGAQGGYLLARDPQEITVGDVLRVLEGPLAPLSCALEEPQELDDCVNPYRCLVREVWMRLHRTIQELLDSITLAELVERARELQARRSPMYFI